MRRTWYVTFALVVGALFLVAAAPANAADDAEIAVEASATEIYIGEGIDYVVEIRNAKSPSSPDLSAIRKDFDVVANGDESRNQSSTYIINGRVTQQNSFGHAYRFRLTPKRTGKLTIPAPTATIDGRTISGQELSLEVIAPEAQDVVIPEVKTNRTRVYPTQPFEVTMRVLVHPLPGGSDRDPVAVLCRNGRPPHLEINWIDPPAGLASDDKKAWLNKLLAEDDAGFTLNDLTTRTGSFFEGPRSAIFNLYQGRETRNGLDGQPVNYYVYELKRTLIAEKPGLYPLGPALVKGLFVTGSSDSRFTTRRLVAVAPVVPIEVREVPSPRPATYCGGIGMYSVTASASPPSLRVGDPLTLTLNIERGEGSGSLDLISAPDLATIPKLAGDFEILDKNPTGHKEGNIKRFDYGLRPKRAGVNVPVLTVGVFNPDTEKFSEIATEPIALNVSAGSRLDAAELVGSVTGPANPEIKSRSQGIFQNIMDPSEVHDDRVNVTLLAGIAGGLWLGVAGMIAGLSSHRRKSGDVVWQRRRQAKRTAERKLAEARESVAQGKSREALRAVRAALVGLIADMRNIVGEGLTAAEAESVLAASAVPATERTEVFRLLEAVESAEYGSSAGHEAAAMIDTATALIPRLSRALERGN